MTRDSARRCQEAVSKRPARRCGGCARRAGWGEVGQMLRVKEAPVGPSEWWFGREEKVKFLLSVTPELLWNLFNLVRKQKMTFPSPPPTNLYLHLEQSFPMCPSRRNNGLFFPPHFICSLNHVKHKVTEMIRMESPPPSKFSLTKSRTVQERAGILIGWTHLEHTYRCYLETWATEKEASQQTVTPGTWEYVRRKKFSAEI